MPARKNKTVCACCGAVLTLEATDGPDQENFLPCVLPTSFEWSLPSGRIVPVVGETIYKDAFGSDFSRSAYMERYNIDPEVAYEKMRALSQKNGVSAGLSGNETATEVKNGKKVFRLGRY